MTPPALPRIFSGNQAPVNTTGVFFCPPRQRGPERRLATKPQSCPPCQAEPKRPSQISSQTSKKPPGPPRTGSFARPAPLTPTHPSASGRGPYAIAAFARFRPRPGKAGRRRSPQRPVPPRRAGTPPPPGSAGNGVGRARGQVAPKPVPTIPAVSTGASHHPTTANLASQQ